MNELISVIIPVYNVEPFLDKCIQSVLKQSYQNLEIILIDDGSTDLSPVICDKYAEIDERIKVIHQKNAGLSGARNSGLEAATGQYVVFLDSDDSFENDAIEKMYDLIIKYDADMSMVNFRCVASKGEILREGKLPIDKNEVCMNEREFWALPYENYAAIVVWTKLYKREIWTDLRFPVGKIHEDEAVLHKVLSKCKKISVSNDICINYLVGNTKSIMAQGFTYKSLAAIESYAERIRYYFGKEYDEYLMNCFGMGSRMLIQASEMLDTFPTEAQRLHKDLCKEYKYLAKEIRKRVPDFSTKVRLTLFCVNIKLYAKIRNARNNVTSINQNTTQI